MLTQLAFDCRKEYESIRHMEGSVQMLRLGPPTSENTATIVNAAVQTPLTCCCDPVVALHTREGMAQLLHWWPLRADIVRCLRTGGAAHQR